VGSFSCAPLYSIADASIGPALVEGSFACALEPMPAKQ
jgi:hypothetical protein